MPSSIRRVQGFVLVELVVVLSLAATLATAVTPIFIDIQNKIEERVEQTLASRVQTGITLRQLETLAINGMSAYPAQLDGASVGVVASPTTPLFGNVLNPPLTVGWSKEGTYRYRSPGGNTYVYDPESGTFLGEQSAEMEGGGGGETNPLGNVIYEESGITFYDSGAVVDANSEVAYVPGSEGDQKTLNLARAIQVQVGGDGSAKIVTAEGKSLDVEDIQKGKIFEWSPPGNSPDELISESAWVQNGQAGESRSRTHYLRREYLEREGGADFDYEYEVDGSFSGGSLAEEYGSVYQSNYQSKTPQKISGAWRRTETGNIEGHFEQSYNYESGSTYAYNHPGEYEYAFSQTGETFGTSRTDYVYDVQTQVYQHRYQGSHHYEANTEATSGNKVVNVVYDYEGNSSYDKKNKSYKSEMRYRYEDGRDMTYQYEYDEKDRTYTWTMIDHKTGKQLTGSGEIKGREEDEGNENEDNEDDDEEEKEEGDRGRGR